MLQYLFNYLWKSRNFVKVSSQWYVNLWNYYYTFERKFKIFSLRLPFANYSHLYQLIGEGLGNPLQYSCLENPMDGGAWWATVHGVDKSWRWLSDFTFTFHFHALEREMATHSSVLAWRILGTEEAGGLPSMGLHRVGHDWSDLAAAVTN